MYCGYCKSERLNLKNDGEGRTGLYCHDCGRWLRWVDPSEKQKISDEIERQKREIRIDGADVESVKDRLRGYRKRLEQLNSEMNYFAERNEKKLITSDIEKSAMYEKALKIKELNTKIIAYNEVLMALKL